MEAGEADAAGDGGLLSDADVPVVTFCDTVDGAALCLDFEGPNALNKNVLGDAGVTLKGAGDGGIIVDKQDSNKFLERCFPDEHSLPTHLAERLHALLHRSVAN